MLYVIHGNVCASATEMQFKAMMCIKSSEASGIPGDELHSVIF